MKTLLNRALIFLITLNGFFTGCSKGPVDSNSFVSPPPPPPPPPPPVITLCPNRPVINASLIPMGSLSAARTRMMTATAGNKILFIGGWYKEGNWWNDPVPVDIYDISTGSWSLHFLVPDIPQLSHFRFGAGVASVGNKIFIAGGGDAMGDNQTSRVDVYDVSSNIWTVKQLSAERQGVAAATVGNKVLFAGGFGYPKGSTGGEFNTVDIYDNSNDSWSTAALSQARMDITATTAGNKVYFAGGSSSSGSSNISTTIDIYNAITNSWSVSSLLQPRTYMASIAAGGKIFWAGGLKSLNGNQWIYNDNAEIHDVNSGTTSSTCILARAGFSAIQKNEHLVFFTRGIGGNGHQFEIYNTTSGEWSTGILDRTIEDAAIISVNNTIYVAGGRVNGVPSKEVWKLEF